MNKFDKSDCLMIKECILKGIIDIETLSEKELDALIDFETENIIESETEPDTSFLDACYAAVRKFHDYGEIISEEKCNEAAEKAYAGFLAQGLRGKRTKKRKAWAKRAAAACAAMLAICFTSFSVMAASLGGYSAAWKYVSENVSSIMGLSGTTNVGNITLIKGDYTKKYNTIEELLIAENLDILYPSALPEGVKIERIDIIYYNKDKFNIMFEFNTYDYFFEVCNDLYGDLDDFENYNVYTHNDLKFYIIDIPEGYQATARKYEYEYNITCMDYTDLIYIIDNMKGITT